MDRGGRLDAVRDVSAEGRAGDGRRRAAGGPAISQRGPEHHRLVRSHPEERGDEEPGGRIMRAHRVTRRGFGARHGLRTALARLAAIAAAAVAATAATIMGASAAMVDNAHRSLVAGVDLITYQTGVKDVVVILGSLPAGDAMTGSGNIAIPTLTGMMLDRGTKTLDKFQIADRLDSVGAQISFGVGTQTLEIRAKCLKK